VQYETPAPCQYGNKVIGPTSAPKYKKIHLKWRNSGPFAISRGR
jgi:hypothetical protein